MFILPLFELDEKYLHVFFLRDLIEIFPNCKIILTLSRDPGSWFDVVKSSFYSPEEVYSAVKSGKIRFYTIYSHAFLSSR